MTMDEKFFERARDFYLKAADTPQGKKWISKQDRTFQFNVKGGEPFYVEIEGGKLTVHPGLSEKRGFYVTPIETDKEMLQRVLQAKIGPVDAIETDRFKLVAGSFNGSQITLLTKIAQDLVSKEIVENYDWKDSR